MSGPRQDLLHLSPEALAQAANLGLVKRAQRELEGGKGPALELDAAGTLSALFADGTRVRWAAGQGIQEAACSCGAAGACRHRIMAALAYRSQAEAAPPLVSPAAVSDAELAQLLPPRLLALAHSLQERGLSVELRDTAAGEPCPTARLPTATVRFWAGARIEAARCDCVAGGACEHLALAVWAFRAAGEGAAPLCQVQLGAPQAAAHLDRQPYLALAGSLLRHGVQQGAALHAQAFTGALEAARSEGAVWLQLLLAELESWSQAYAARSARFRLQDGVRLLAELALRLGAGTRPGRARDALGLGEVEESELDRLRLITLGCRVDQEGEDCHARLVLADMDTASRFVLHHRWQEPGGGPPDLGRQRLAPGVRLLQLASGQLLATQARRRADGTLLLARARSSQNSLLPQDGDWRSLGPPLAFASVAGLRAEKLAHPLPMAEARHAAGRYLLFQAGPPEQLFYDPQQQTLVALLRDEAGEALLLQYRHRGRQRHGLDALAGALSGALGPLRQVAGVLTWQGGTPCLEPWALACDRLVLPDLEAPGSCSGALARLPLGELQAPAPEGPVGAVQRLLELLAELPHQGFVRLTRHWRDSAAALATRLQALSLSALAQGLAALLEELARAQASPADHQLPEAYLQLAVLALLHEEAGALVGEA